MQNKYAKPLSTLVRASGNIAGISILLMIVITCADIILRKCGLSITGAYDINRLLGAIAIASALPLTTAVKGHVAIEYFFHLFPRKARNAIDFIMRALQATAFFIAFFAFLNYGTRLLKSHEVMATIPIPTFWCPWLIALSCLLTSLVSIFHLLFPKEKLITHNIRGTK